MTQEELDAVDTFVDYLCQEIRKDGFHSVTPEWIAASYSVFAGEENEDEEDVTE